MYALVPFLLTMILSVATVQESEQGSRSRRDQEPQQQETRKQETQQQEKAAAQEPGGAQTIQEAYAQLESAAKQLRQARQAAEGDGDEARQALVEQYHEFQRRMTQFVTQQLGGELSDQAAEIVVRSSRNPELTSLVHAYARVGLEKSDPEDFVASLEKLQQAGLSETALDVLAGPRAIALFAAGQDQQALDFLEAQIQESGEQSLRLLDVKAAILAARGRVDEARQLFQEYQDTYGSSDDAGAYQYASKAELIGQNAPSLKVAEWVGPKGTETEGWSGLDELQGKVVVLDFWQPWCAPCRAIMPQLSQLQEKFSGQPVQVIGMVYDDAQGPSGRPGFDASKQQPVPAEKVAGENYVPHIRDFSENLGLEYVMAVAEDRTNNDAYQVKGIPTLVVVDPKGRIAWMTVGAGAGTEVLLEELIQRMLKDGDSEGA